MDLIAVESRFCVCGRRIKWVSAWMHDFHFYCSEDCAIEAAARG